ncbi:hypothetical protein L4X63_01840 [Geomonas sp. Red32]|uniref:hypothetical protein n=1 Tax=Geomonas sp. Red32 TaxID=2912856 RepID=UPI00202CDE02|nr:hypothetical protein [Geomonas sp. Red32]MCM0080319.1 hypothetical protein [Geomonas sp. Red32]
MCWHAAMEHAEKTLESPLVPASQDLISLIKKVNPTSLCLSESEREYGYEVKSRLQNLLLEQYGEAFYLDPHPLNPKIVLIKHATLPSVDACHTELVELSGRALDSVAVHHTPSPATARKPPRKEKKKGPVVAGDSPADALKCGLARLAEYDFEGAAELLAGIRISARHEIAILERAARALVDEMGAYPQAVELLLGQQGQFLRDATLRVLLARTYHLLGAVSEARLFSIAYPGAHSTRKPW